MSDKNEIKATIKEMIKSGELSVELITREIGNGEYSDLSVRVLVDDEEVSSCGGVWIKTIV